MLLHLCILVLQAWIVYVNGETEWTLDHLEEFGNLNFENMIEDLPLLQEWLMRCRLENWINPFYALNSKDKKYIQSCNYIQYVGDAVYEWKKLNRVVRVPIDIRIVGEIESIPFTQMFTKFSMEKKPVAFRYSFANKSTSIPACRLQEKSSSALVNVDHVAIPKLMSHDYFQRVPNDIASMTKNIFGPRVITSDQWQKCPLMAHTVIIPIADGTVEAVVSKNIFQQPGRNIPQDILDTEYSPLWNDMVDPFKNAKLITLQKGDALFIPNTMYGAIKNAYHASEFVRLCFADASNWQDVQKASARAALRDVTIRPLIDAFYAGKIDTSMDQAFQPEKLTWQIFTEWPRKDSVASLPEDGQAVSRKERFKRWQDVARWNRHIAELTLPIAEAPKVSHVDRNNAKIVYPDIFKIRRDDVTAYGYEIRWYRADETMNAISFMPDLTNKVDGLRQEGTSLNKSVLPTDRFGAHFDGQEVMTSIGHLVPATTYCFTVAPYSAEVLGRESMCSGLVSTMPIATPSIVPGIPNITMVSSTSITVEWTKPQDDGGIPIKNYVLSRRQIAARNDTGLGNIDVVLQNVNQNAIQKFSESVVVQAISTKAAWHGLIPGRSYQVRVEATNEKGSGPPSVPSITFVMPKVKSPSAQPGHVYGIGHKKFQRVVYVHTESDGYRRLLAVQDKDQVETKGPLSHLSDRDQVLTIYAPANAPIRKQVRMTAEIWAGHFSPRVYDITSGLPFYN